MATQAQKDAVKLLHIFADKSGVVAEYPFSEGGVVQAGKTTYDIAHKDPYELLEVGENGAGQVTHTATFTMIVGENGVHKGYKGTPTTTTPFGDLTPKIFAGVNVFMIETQNGMVKALFTDSEHHSISADLIETINLDLDGTNEDLVHYYDAYSDSTQYLAEGGVLFTLLDGKSVGDTVIVTISATSK